MIDGFDELFDKFFGNNKKDKNKGKGKGKIDELINMLNSYKEITGKEINENSELGEPDSVVEYTKDGIIYEKKTWEINGGKIVKIEVKHVKLDGVFDIPITIKPSRFKEAPLEEQLQHAISVEDYEKAAEIRDAINKRENQIVNEPKKRGRPKKNK